MGAVGGASAIAALAELALKTSVAAKHVVQSFVNVPKEVVKPVAQVRTTAFRALIEQIHAMSREMSAADAANLLLPGEPRAAVVWARAELRGAAKDRQPGQAVYW